MNENCCILLVSYIVVLMMCGLTNIKFVMQSQLAVDYKHDILIFEYGVGMYRCA